ncbi:hypothetical protein EDM57_05010 [Brevibacillus gelatini]|uniref:GmrSD restriction endonucleases N-terminal domain-containing protein n=1 Tax=Brevibacillus gelatini TaxID=1655277 RepID=A0A3M8B873_9BACL|nr:DUF262 domain-containing protein [Brevibacillus gelatini]RNB59502.1 hypothetical protein EDM57_05010 [Brevibacillus gelatini]
MLRKSVSWNVKQICTMINKGTITFDHPLQRPADQWTIANSTLLIDSLLTMFIPDVYAVQLSEEVDGKKVNKYAIIDGKQRLTRIHEYKQDLWALDTLPPIVLESTGEEYDISGLKFSELPEEVQEEINGYTVTIKAIEIQEGEDEEEIIEKIFYRLNNGVSMARQHLCLVSASKQVQKFVSEIVSTHKLFTEVSHFTTGGVKKSDKEMAVLQTIMLASGLDFKSFASRDVEDFFKENKDLDDSVMNKTKQAFDMLVDGFNEYNKFITKINLVSFAGFIVEHNFDQKTIDFLKYYAQTSKKGDAYRKYCGAGNVKLDNVKKRLAALSNLYAEYIGQL